MPTLTDLLYKTINRSKKDVDIIADEIGLSANYLRRSGLPCDDKFSRSGVKFPVQYLVPLMKATGDFSVLKYLAELSGFLLVKIPRYNGKTTDEMNLLNTYQISTNKASGLLLDFFKKPSPENLDKVNSALLDVMTKSVEAKKFCEKTVKAQIEMEF